ncbi:MAG: hypothetical protein N2749_01275 [Clostridia bacterium]|nr:hypothetical protein [Clostridia bacterium]
MAKNIKGNNNGKVEKHYKSASNGLLKDSKVSCSTCPPIPSKTGKFNNQNKNNPK